MDMIFDYILILFFPLILITGVTIFLIKAPRKDKLIRPLRNQKVLFGFLILWTLLGFFTQQDFTERCGCLVHSRGIFSLDYIIFSSISLILLILGFFIRNRFVRISILWIELAYWIFKLFALKSGYQGGLGILVFKYYDFFGLLGRFLLINSLLGYKFKEYVLPLVAGVIIIIKMFGVPCNENFIYRDYLNPYHTRLMFEQLNGNWTGEMTYPKDTLIYKPFDSTSMYDLMRFHDTLTYRDTTIYKEMKGVNLLIKDSILGINNALPKLNGNYCLMYSQPDSRYFVYIPQEYKAELDKDYYKYWQYSISLIFGNITDSTLTLEIENGIEMTLKTAGNTR